MVANPLSRLPIILVLGQVIRVLASLPTTTSAFTYDNTSFLLDGTPFVIIGGQMDPQRIPPEYWRDRLAKARAMGLNTIFSYVYWNLLEPEQGVWTGNQGGNAIAEYFKIAQEEDLKVVLRPGPYICGEREWGGFPAWLSEIPDMVVRTYNEPFLNASQRYIERLANDIRELQITKGGPLIMVQVENEYGSYGDNHEYTIAVRDILRNNFEVPLYTNDGGVEWTLKGGEVSGVLAEIDGDPWYGFRARQTYITNPTELGPLMDGEYYTLAPDLWGSANSHNTADGRPSQTDQFIKDLDYVLGNNNSISLYMFHGGTNFGFSNGALWKNYTAPFTTSYDYGSPLDESGRVNELYFTLRDTIQKYVPEGSIPTVPENIPLLTIPDFSLTPIASLFDLVENKTYSWPPLTMETLKQAYGFVLYEHRVMSLVQGNLKPGDRARDRVIVYVNGTRQGVIDSTYPNPANVALSLMPGDRLQILVENLGRVNYWSKESNTFKALEEQHKGIMGKVRVGGYILEGWDIYSLPMETPPLPKENSNLSYAILEARVGSSPTIYKGSFWVDKSYSTAAQLDSFLAVPTGIKGNIWVNGLNLGRYWIIGPQQSLYLPGTVVKSGAWNEVIILELEPSGQNMIARGLSEREWANYPDPDAPPKNR